MAVPHPQKELDRALKLAGGPLPPVVVLSGASAWFRGQAVDALHKAVPAATELVTVDGQGTSARGVRDDGDAAGDDDETEADAGSAAACPDLEPLRGGGLFARTAVVVVRRGDRWLKRYAAAVAAMLPRIQKGSTLVVEAQKLDKRTKFAKSLQEGGAVFEFRELYETPFGRPDRLLEGELVEWVLTRARALGVPLHPEAALLLVMQVGKAPGELLAELEQLAVRVGPDAKRRPLQPDDLRGKLTTSFESTPFELAEAVLGGDRRRALRSLRAMFDRGVKQRDGKSMDQAGLFPFATSWLFSSIGQILEGRLLLDGGTALRDVAARAGVHMFQERFADQVRRNDRRQLEHGLLALLSCQREKRLTGEDDDVLLERFLSRWFDRLPVPAAQELEW